MRNGWWAGLLKLLLLSAVVRAQTSPATADSLSGAPAGSLTTVGGVRYVVRHMGSGPRPQPHDRVTVHYSGYLPTGQLFDSSAPTGRPLRFRVGRAEVISGWDELLPLLAAGTRIRAWIPARLAYGSRGVPNAEDGYLIPPNTDLIFDLELLGVR
ncbi:MAG: FKBP-type peptidyl-prolyl cis-trans isomerase [Hymenobacter sp.]|nr:FKBP-type peptidyl-prolyl cis-trans isomerase [Hymenobacter sp.]